MDYVIDRPATLLLPKGTQWARFLQELCVHGGDVYAAYESAARRFPGQPGIAKALGIMAGIEKAAVSAGSTGGWGSPLAVSGVAGDVLPLVYEGIVLGRIAPSARKVPFGAPFPRALTRPSASWVGQGLAKRASAGTFDMVDPIERRKVSVIVAFARELARLGPRSEGVFRELSVDAVRLAVDETFLNPANAGDGNTPPAITNGVVEIASSGTTVDALTADIAVLVDALDDLQAPFFIARPRTAIGLAATTLSDPQGRYLAGVPLLRSRGAPDGTLVLVDAAAIAFADDGDVEVSVAEHASLQLDDAPSAGAQPQVSLWQSGLIGLRVEHFISWTVMRDNAVAILTGLWT